MLKVEDLRFQYTRTGNPVLNGASLELGQGEGGEGFLLSNYPVELSELFEAGVDFDYYTSEDELVEKIHYYLSHEKERKEMAHNAFEKVLKEFDYKNRIEKLLELALA